MADTLQAGLSMPERQEKLPILGIFRTTFQIFGRAPISFLLMALITQLPMIARLVISAPTSSKFTLASGIVLVVNLLILFLVQTAMTVMAVRIARGERVSVGEALGQGARRYLAMLGTLLLVMLAVYGGMLLIIVPGIIFACMYAVAVPVCALEGTGPVASMKRSGALTKYSRWRILGVYILFFLPLLVISMLVTFLVTLRGHFVQSQWINVVIQLFWVPLASIFSASIYIELRRLKENVGIAQVFD